MKKVIFLLVLFLFSLTEIQANEKSLEYNGYYSGNNRKSFNFVQDNVHFMVYQNGEFDFFIQPNRFRVNIDFGVVDISFNSGYNYDAYVQYDDYGAVIQIENIPIYYDYYGRISRIGSTYIRYNNRRLIQFGNMYVHYNHYGYFDYSSGYINIHNHHYNYRPYIRYFTRPIYEHCLVSYNPYRRYYTPVRYRYNSVDYRSRARRTRIARNSVRRSVPKRVASRTRTSVRQNTAIRTMRNSAVRNNRSTNSVRFNNATRTTSSIRSIRSNSTRTAQTKPVRQVRSVRNSNARTGNNYPRTTSVRNHKTRSVVINNSRNAKIRKTTSISKNRKVASLRKKQHTRHSSR